LSSQTKPISLNGASGPRHRVRARHYLLSLLRFNELRLGYTLHGIDHRLRSLTRNNAIRQKRNCRVPGRARRLKPESCLPIIWLKVLACVQSTCICELQKRAYRPVF
jgi:hypothetical protein